MLLDRDRTLVRCVISASSTRQILWQEEGSQHQISLEYLPRLVKQTLFLATEVFVSLYLAKTAAVALISLLELRETLYCCLLSQQVSVNTMLPVSKLIYL